MTLRKVCVNNLELWLLPDSVENNSINRAFQNKLFKIGLQDLTVNVILDPADNIHGFKIDQMPLIWDGSIRATRNSSEEFMRATFRKEIMQGAGDDYEN